MADGNGREPVGIQRGLTNYGDPGFSVFIRRAFCKGLGLSDEDLDRPIVGICNTWSEFNHCHGNLKQVAEAVKRGVWQAGGTPLEFPTISLGEIFLSPTSMLYRNLMAMDTEEMIRAQPMDAVVLLGGCDKTTPAQLMGAASADVPAIMVTTGPMLSGSYQGQQLGACSDCRRYWGEYRAGTIDETILGEVEERLCPSAGPCMVMGTASTMACLAEALGLMLPGSAAPPAVDSRRIRIAEAAGRRAVGLARERLRPSQIMTEAAFENAIRVLMAIGGSPNAVIHLVAIAGRLGIKLPLDRFDELSRTTPLLVNLRPVGTYQMDALFEAGGLPPILKELEPLLRLDPPTVTGRTLGEELSGVPRAERSREVIRSLAEPLHQEGGLAILRGNLAPDGAVIKHSAASPQFLKHRGRAVVFASVADLAARIDDPDLDVRPDDILVLQNAGPVGAPGMPEAGYLPLPKKILAQGVRDMVRISDARMSGTASGTIVLHVAPEAAVGGPLALARNGDQIELDVVARRLELLVPEAELADRRRQWAAPPRPYERGYRRLYVDHVLQADRGCDLDFLVG
ncbi:MAG: dihydroxy-acid dehydratase [Chloroflexi bacterium]|nr:dihydroxy-acid dehydratase [Chloroflexota bacterium]